MTDFLIKSVISMALLLAVYHLFLEREKMHRFNRFYLLFALAFSLVLPFVTFTIYKEVTAEPQPIFQEDIQLLATVTEVNEPVDYITPALWALYALITLVLVVKFIKNIHYFTKQARKNPTQKRETATLVLLEEKVIPHTFLSYIFISREEYSQNNIEDELYTHELAHVNQMHTLDILFIELLKTVLWFNPLLHFYKKAIQLNHEFLADETVVNLNTNVTDYQKLLLQKAVPATAYQLASSLNFNITKKRFKMMTKATPKRKALLLKLAALPVIVGLVYALCTEVVAQTTGADEIGAEAIVEMPNNNGKADPKRDRYYAGVKVVVLNEKREKLIDKPYEELTEAEKDKYLNPIPKPTQKKQISVKEYEALKDKKTFAVWVDEKLIDNKELNKFTPEDFAFYSGSPVYKNARSKKFPQPFQYTLYTHKYFDDNMKDSYKKFGGTTYKVVTGSYVKTPDLQPATVNPEDITPEMYAEYLEFLKAKGIATDTVKKHKLSPETEARKAFLMDERKKMQEERRAAFAKRDSAKGKSRISIEERNRKQDSMRAARKKLSEELMVKAIAERKNPVYQEDKLYKGDDVSVKPEYPGGIMEFYTFVNDNLKIPENLNGLVKIYVSFIVEKDGSLSTMKILKDPGYGAADETLRVLKLSKKWVPANIDGKPVRYNYYLPILLNVK